ncbi:hypothetical protein L210DRAFT_3577140 [Boletus edulis BED1]|uniref:Uncharacterized protein n=1 Tax=Boletus edulis BED1 TaxID=1328754 RepID=A0AAD4G668_BOLED|nr:hypothetical protein L210DRAFT_3577140 [Boletus edulis BED1]
MSLWAAHIRIRRCVTIVAVCWTSLSVRIRRIRWPFVIKILNPHSNWKVSFSAAWFFSSGSAPPHHLPETGSVRSCIW